MDKKGRPGIHATVSGDEIRVDFIVAIRTKLSDGTFPDLRSRIGAEDLRPKLMRDFGILPTER